jgi:hypothetical protein
MNGRSWLRIDRSDRARLHHAHYDIRQRGVATGESFDPRSLHKPETATAWVAGAIEAFAVSWLADVQSCEPVGGPSLAADTIPNEKVSVGIVLLFHRSQSLVVRSPI